MNEAADIPVSDRSENPQLGHPVEESERIPMPNVRRTSFCVWSCCSLRKESITLIPMSKATEKNNS